LALLDGLRRTASDNCTVLGRLIVVVALVAVSCSHSGPRASTPEWDAPRARWVSDLGRHDRPYTYNTISAVSDSGRHVVFVSHVKDFPSRLFLAETKRGTIRRIDRSYKGGRPTSEGIGRYNTALEGGYPEITPEGRYVVFASPYSDLVRRDGNRATDVFVYDRVERRTRLVSRSSDGTQANGSSTDPTITADGRYVAFTSRATNLAPEDTTRSGDVYVRDMQKGTTTLVSVGLRGKGNRASGLPGISDDGSRISFLSRATNLVEGDTNAALDAFVRDVAESTTVRVSVTSEGEQLQSFVYAESASTYREGAGALDISGNGKVVVFASHVNGLVPEDSNDNVDIFVHEIDSGVTERVSVRSDGGDAYGPEDRECGNNGECFTFIESREPAISGDGRLVYFLSASPRISDEDAGGSSGPEEDVFVHDGISGDTVLVSRNPDGSPVRAWNFYPGSISANGTWITYSADSGKVDGPGGGDHDASSDVFLQELPAFRAT
jgi:Tol biopolymer transport system component